MNGFDAMGDTSAKGRREPFAPDAYDLRFQAAAPPAMAYLGPYPAAASGRVALTPPAVARPRRESRFARWRRRNAGKYWWKILLFGLLIYLGATVLLAVTLATTLVPFVILLGGGVVPVAFVAYCWERGAFAEMPVGVLGLAFASGALVGLPVAVSLESMLVTPIPLVGMFTVGVIEEAAKALAIVWFLGDRRLRGERDGLALGAAAGMGFAALETAGYSFTFFLVGFGDSLAHRPSFASAIGDGLLWMTVVLLARMALAVFGHGVWTAIVCAAIWRDRGAATLRITWGVALAFGISAMLHGLWDSAGDLGPFSLAFWPLAAFAGLWLLRFFLREATDRATLGALAPAPDPLMKALALYLVHPRRRPLHAALAHAAALANAQWHGWPMPWPLAPAPYAPPPASMAVGTRAQAAAGWAPPAASLGPGFPPAPRPPAPWGFPPSALI